MALIDPNIPGWERLARGCAGVALIACGLVLPASWAGEGWLQAGLLVAGAGLAATALAGFCPACALAGRLAPRGPRPEGR